MAASSPATTVITSLSKLCQSNVGLLSQKLGLMQAMTVKHGSDKAKEFFQMKCPLVKASVGQHFRHSLDHMELAAKVASSSSSSTTAIAELHYDLRERGCTSEHDMDAAAERIFNVIHMLEAVSIMDEQNQSQSQNQQTQTQNQKQHEHPVHAYFMLSGDADTEYALASSVGRELGFAAHHAIHHLALVKLIATQTIGLSEEDLPAGFGKAPSTIRFHHHHDQEHPTNS
jgi:hypothetical protein